MAGTTARATVFVDVSSVTLSVACSRRSSSRVVTGEAHDHLWRDVTQFAKHIIVVDSVDVNIAIFCWLADLPI